jgi:uncharacterized protein
MIIDPHVHVLDYGHWPNEWWDFVAADWASKEPGRIPEMVRDRIEAGLVDPDGSRLIQHMNEAGVDLSVILPIDWGPDFHAEKSVEEINEHALVCVRRYPERLLAFAGIDPRRDHAAERLDRWLSSGAYKGLKLYPNCGFYPNDPRAKALYEVCLAHDVPVLFHTGDPLPVLSSEYGRPKHFWNVVRDFPALKIIMAHAGAPGEFDEALAVAAASDAAVLEMSVWLWDDSSEADEVKTAHVVAQARDRIGIERVMFGTDHVSGQRIRAPGFLPKVTGMFNRLPDTARKAGLSISQTEHDAFMGGNAARLLKLQQ